MIRLVVILAGLGLMSACTPTQESPASGLELMILGVAQDAGYPQAACEKECCLRHWLGEEPAHLPVSLGILDHNSRQAWMVEASPAFPEQWRQIQAVFPGKSQPDGIFLTHAHIGHYSGLIHLGREVMGASGVPVHAMPGMAGFLEQNGPWSQLVSLGNIRILPMVAEQADSISPGLSVTPLLVPHRDEFSETVGFIIEGPEKKVLFLPDIDKWNRWEKSLAEILRQVDLALIDATFFRNGELPNRDMSEIPHPFVEETMTLLGNVSAEDKSKVVFIHMNHTNPLIWDEEARAEVEVAGFRVAREGMTFSL